jgi:hypothetical protein
VKMRFDSAAMFALFAVAFAGVAHRLGGPTLYGGSPSVDLGQISAWLASVAAVLMAVLKVLQQVQSFVEMLRKPHPLDTKPVYLGPAEPKVGESDPNWDYLNARPVSPNIDGQIAAVKARLAELKAVKSGPISVKPDSYVFQGDSSAILRAEPPTKPEIPPGYVECRLCGNPKIEGQVCSRCGR